MNTFGRKPRLRARLAVPVVALFVWVLCPHQAVSKELLEEKAIDSGIIPLRIALAIAVVVKDFQELERKAGRAHSFPELAARDLGIAFSKEEGGEVAVSILPSTDPLVFGRGVTYWIDLKDYTIREKRAWR
ncbi:MAG: hypothetical protein KatS3mg077_1484 [Candidatus Binatia bacterium]|nr:MAG: hypothetical protein KatS3mg077_1484 [Candidatus Binatia bacterium]